jgi:hypothetical protein
MAKAKKTAGKTTDIEPADELLLHVISNFEAWEESTRDERDEACEARDYVDGHQWTSDEMATLKARKQPIVTDNMLKDKVEYIVGLETAGRSDPKAYPRTPNDEGCAEAITDALRYVAEANDLDTIVSDIAENILVEGSGGCEVDIEQRGSGDKADLFITVTRTPWNRSYRDPYSVEKNFSDSRFRGTFVWMDLDEAQRKWPKVDFDAAQDAQQVIPSESTDDVPVNLWFDSKRQRVRVVQQYFRHEGTVKQCKFVKGAWVEEPKPSVYLDEFGEPEDTYCWMSAYVERNGARYGVVRRYKSLQDEVNHRRSRALFILNSNQVTAEEGAVADKTKARLEAQKPDGWIDLNHGYQFSIDKNTELAAGQAQLLADARQALSITGPKALTNTSASQSGRAKQLDQQNDVLELGRLFDQIRALKREIYTKIYNRIRQFWTEPKWVRIRDEEGAPKFVQLNKPMTALEYAQTLEPDDPEYAEAVMMAQLMPQQIVKVQNNVGELMVDIIIDESPDVLTLQAEQFQNLVSLAGAGVIFPPDVYIEASSLRNKAQLKEKLTGGGDDPAAQKAAQQQQQIQQMQIQLDAMTKTAEIEGKQAKARKDNADAQEQEIENMLATAAVTDLAQN